MLARDGRRHPAGDSACGGNCGPDEALGALSGLALTRRQDAGVPSDH